MTGNIKLEMCMEEEIVNERGMELGKKKRVLGR